MTDKRFMIACSIAGLLAPAAVGAQGSAASTQQAPQTNAADATVPPAPQTHVPQDVNGEGSTGVGDIIVTATRRAERTQDIPAAISAFSGDQLARTGTVDLRTVSVRVPGVSFGSNGALRPQLYIRGIGTASYDPGSESSVGVFADEVYLGNAAGSFGALRDVSRIEVLRGPQGTLYGRNTIGGAINIITNGPTDTFDAQAQVGTSSYKGIDIFGAAGGPIVKDVLSIRATGWYNKRDGYVTNLATGKQIQGIDNQGLRGRATIKPLSGLKVDLSGEWTHDGDKAAFAGFNQGNTSGLNTVFLAAPGRVPQTTGNLYSNYSNVDPTLERNSYAYTARAEYDANPVTVTSISAWRRVDARDTRDVDGTTLAVLAQSTLQRSRQFTQEIRIASNRSGPLSFGGHVDWLIGGFYYIDHSARFDSFEVGADSSIRASLGTPSTDTAIGLYTSRSYAVFGQATVRFGDHFELTAGGRYNIDKKRANQIGQTMDNLPVIPAPFDVSNAIEYKRFDPRIVATYKVDRDISIYASYSTGFKDGGFQFNPFTTGQAGQTFAPEKVTAYEAGIKSDLLNKKLRINLSSFYYDYKNLQLLQIILVGNSAANLITNAASSTIKGIELEVQARPTSSIDIGASYGFLDAKYDSYPFNATLDFSNTRLVRAPKNTANGYLEFHRPFSFGNFTLRGDVTYTSTFYWAPGQGEVKYGAGVPLTTEKGYALANLSTSIEQGSFTLSGYITNVTNKQYRRSVNTLGTTVIGFASEPRIFGLRFGYRY